MAKRAIDDDTRKCDTCGRRAPLLIEMAGTEPWWLCSKCWIEPFVKLEGAKDDEGNES